MYWLRGHPFENGTSRAIITILFLFIGWYPAIDRRGEWFSYTSKTNMDGQQTIREALQMPFEKPSKDLFRHNAPSWMDLGHLWNARTRDSASGYPLEVMVKPTDDWKSEKLIPYILRGRNRAALFRYLLLDPLM